MKKNSVNQKQGWPSLFSDRPQKKTKVAENVEYLLRKFRQIPFSSFLAEVENAEGLRALNKKTNKQNQATEAIFPNWKKKLFNL